MNAPTLTLRKLSYSVHPWRIGLLHDGGRFQELAHLTFPRKRDALPVLRALVALALDWTVPPETWPALKRTAVARLVTASPGWELHQRGLRSWETHP